METTEISVNELSASLAAYRHAIKDIARESDPEKMRLACIKALHDNDMRDLGTKFHYVIKAAVKLTKAGEGFDAHAWEDAKDEFFKFVKALPKGATMESWLA